MPRKYVKKTDQAARDHSQGIGRFFGQAGGGNPPQAVTGNERIGNEAGQIGNEAGSDEPRAPVPVAVAPEGCSHHPTAASTGNGATGADDDGEDFDESDERGDDEGSYDYEYWPKHVTEWVKDVKKSFCCIFDYYSWKKTP